MCPNQATHTLVTVVAVRAMQLPTVVSVFQKVQEPYSATEITIREWPSSSNGCSHLEGKDMLDVSCVILISIFHKEGQI